MKYFDTLLLPSMMSKNSITYLLSVFYWVGWTIPMASIDCSATPYTVNIPNFEDFFSQFFQTLTHSLSGLKLVEFVNLKMRSKILTNHEKYFALLFDTQTISSSRIFIISIDLIRKLIFFARKLGSLYSHFLD